MSLQLVKNSTTDEYSYGGAGDDPVPNTVTLDDSSTPATEETNILNLEIRATDYLYEAIALSIENEEAGINYELSLDNTNWFDALTSGAGGLDIGEIPDMDATTINKTQDVYVKAIVANDGSVTAGTKTTPKLRLIGTEIQ